MVNRIDKQLNVLHLVTLDSGGATKAVERISGALKKAGINSSILTLRQLNTKKFIFIKRVFNAFYRLTVKPNKEFSHNLIGILFDDDILKEYDIIHLHWVSGFVGVNTFRQFRKLGKPIVWTMHDMRPFTAVCHYSGKCSGFRNGCRKCMYFRVGFKWIAKLNIRLYEHVLRDMNVIVIGCSNWITDAAHMSSIFQNNKCCCIPNCIDNARYKSRDKYMSLKKMGLLALLNKRILLFGAMNPRDTRKGIDIIDAIIPALSEEYICITIGDYSIRNSKMVSLGAIKEESLLVDVYNCADIVLVPSIQENLSNMVMEALACGKPVVAFDVGGMPDMIEHKVNGYLAKPYDVIDFLHGIDYCYEQDMKQAAIESIENFKESDVALSYIKTYKELID